MHSLLKFSCCKFSSISWKVEKENEQCSLKESNLGLTDLLFTTLPPNLTAVLALGSSFLGWIHMLSWSRHWWGPILARETLPSMMWFSMNTAGKQIIQRSHKNRSYTGIKVKHSLNRVEKSSCDSSGIRNYGCSRTSWSKHKNYVVWLDVKLCSY